MGKRLERDFDDETEAMGYRVRGRSRNKLRWERYSEEHLGDGHKRARTKRKLPKHVEFSAY